MEEVFTIVKVFTLAFVIDLAWALYILAVANRLKLLAGLFSMMIGAPAIFGYLEIINNHWMIIPYLLGLGVGTVFGIQSDEKIKSVFPRARLVKNGVQRESDRPL